jgi:Leucine-rich repeat (LRR) protein
MEKINLLIIWLLLTCFSINGQENNSVKIIQGRKAPFQSQKILDLSYQNLKELPPDVSNQEIEILILDNNNIENLPRRIGNLKNLRILSVRNNKLSELNSAISFCENLEQLYLSGNTNLKELPSLSFCNKLEIIDVINTGINEVPVWIEMLDSLFYFKHSTLTEK